MMPSPSPSTSTSQCQLPPLPWEITDSIIDHLHSDLRALGVCGMVCSEWLVRSRYHIFSTVQLWPWRIRNFINLTLSRSCTFSGHIQRIEMDDLKVRPNSITASENVQFCDALSLSYLPCLSGVESIQVRNVDWTTLSPIEQTQLRQRLANFKSLKRLEFDDVIFHDLREVVHIVNSFPLMKHLTANVSFMMYTEHAINSAVTLSLPNVLKTVELATEDGIPVVLSCISAREAQPHLECLNLRQIKPEHLPFIHKSIRKIGGGLHDLLIGFHETGWEGVTEDEISKTFKISRLNQLRNLSFEGLTLSKKYSSSIITTILPRLLSRLESPLLESMKLEFSLELESELETLNWQHLSRVFAELHFFGLRRVGIHVAQMGSSTNAYEIGQSIRKRMGDLDGRGVLHIQVHEMNEEDHRGGALYSRGPLPNTKTLISSSVEFAIC